MSTNIWLDIQKLEALDTKIIDKIRDEYYADDIELPNNILGWVENDFEIYFESAGKIKPTYLLNKIVEINI